MIDISKLNKAILLAALYNQAKSVDFGRMQLNSAKMSVTEAEEILAEQTDFDYLKGRVMKVNLSGDSMRTDLYNNDNGHNAAERIINGLLAS